MITLVDPCPEYGELTATVPPAFEVEGAMTYVLGHPKKNISYLEAETYE